MTVDADGVWTPQRRRALEIVIRHVVPVPWDYSALEQQSRPAMAAEDPSSSAQVIGALAERRFAGQEIFVVAVLDELIERAASQLGELPPDELESILRAIETAVDPYLDHGLRLLLGLSLEARYASRTSRRLGAFQGTDKPGQNRDRARN